jgi:hypothetical protein
VGFFGKAFLTASVVSGWINNARTNKEIKRIYKDTAEANYTSRAVYALPHINRTQLLLTPVDSTEIDNDICVYESKSTTPAIDYIWGGSVGPESIIVSGGRLDERTNTLMPFIRKSQQEDIPVIALHTGNKDLEALAGSNSVYCEVVSRGEHYYDVFRSLPIEDIAFLLYETMPDDDASPSAEALLRSMLEVLLRTEGKVTFQSLSAFPLVTLMDTLNTLKASHAVTTEEYASISRDYMAGSSEIDAVRTFLNKLNRQAESVYGKLTANSCNVRKTLNAKGVITIDVGLGSNNLVISLVINHLLYLQSAGRDFSIILDSLAIAKISKISDLLNGRTYAISHNDFVSALHGGDRTGEDMFAEITGNVNTLVLFSHKSGTSCKKWSEHLGKYHKIKIKMNISQTSSFLMGNNTKGISVEETDEPRVRAETISMLPDSLACIHNKEGTLIAEI